MTPQNSYGSHRSSWLVCAIYTVSLSLAIILLTYMDDLGQPGPSLSLWLTLITTTMLVTLPIAVVAVEFDEEVGRLRKLLPTDRITGLISAGLFDMSARHHLERRTTTIQDNAIVLFEIDYFNRIQSEMGEKGAERLLRRTSEIVHRSTRGPQDKLSRIDDARFILMLTRLTPDEAETTCARLMETLHLELRRLKPELSAVTLSFGIASLRDGEDLDEARETAELALRDASRFGGAQIRYRFGDEVRFAS